MILKIEILNIFSQKILKCRIIVYCQILFKKKYVKVFYFYLPFDKNVLCQHHVLLIILYLILYNLIKYLQQIEHLPWIRVRVI